MKALQVDEFASAVRVRTAEIPDPERGDGVLIAVTASGLGLPDLLVARGAYQVRPPLPFVPGMEVNGHVLRAPDRGWVGRRVVALSRVAAPSASSYLRTRSIR